MHAVSRRTDQPLVKLVPPAASARPNTAECAQTGLLRELTSALGKAAVSATGMPLHVCRLTFIRGHSCGCSTPGSGFAIDASCSNTRVGHCEHQHTSESVIAAQCMGQDLLSGSHKALQRQPCGTYDMANCATQRQLWSKQARMSASPAAAAGAQPAFLRCHAPGTGPYGPGISYSCRAPAPPPCAADLASQWPVHLNGQCFSAAAAASAAAGSHGRCSGAVHHAMLHCLSSTRGTIL